MPPMEPHPAARVITVIINRMRIERAMRLALTGVLFAACDRGHHEAPPPPAPANPPSHEVAKGCTLPAISTKVPGEPSRIVAIGDLHGDLGGARAALKAAGAIDDSDKWIGGELVVVQT